MAFAWARWYSTVGPEEEDEEAAAGAEVEGAAGAAGAVVAAVGLTRPPSEAVAGVARERRGCERRGREGGRDGE